MGNILKYVFDKFGCKHEAYDKKDIDDKIKTINENLNSINTNIGTINNNITSANNKITSLQTKDTELNTKITNLQNNVYVKGNFAVITGNVSMTNGEGTTNVNYPSGFTKDNCIVLTMNVGNSTNTEISYSYGIVLDVSGAAVGAVYHRASLGGSNIGIKVKNYTDSGNYTFRFKIVLMKI